MVLERFIFSIQIFIKYIVSATSIFSALALKTFSRKTGITVYCSEVRKLRRSNKQMTWWFEINN